MLVNRYLSDIAKVTIEEQLGKRIQDLRKRKGMTQESLAASSGVDYKHLQKLEGKTPSSPTLSTIAALAEALDLEPWELLKFDS